MKKLIILAMVSMFVVPLLVFAAGQDVEVSPLQLSVVGQTNEIFNETRWPDFYQFIPAGGCSSLSDYSNKRKIASGVPALYPDLDADGLFDYVTDTDASGTVVYEYTPQETEYVTIAGTDLTVDLSVDLAEYRDTAAIEVIWSIEVLGTGRPLAVNRSHAPWFGGGCAGTSRQSFTKGNAYVRLFVRADGGSWEAKGEVTSIPMPFGGTGQTTSPVDPTRRGGTLLTRDDFNSQLPLPEVIDLQIRIYNDTGMQLSTPANARTVLATITPIN